MKKVPEAGYKIEGLKMSGIQRRFTFENLFFPIKLIKSVLKSFNIINQFKPDAVVGVGGYASGPLLYAAGLKKIPILIQEQNSYAGLTNKWLSRYAKTICVAHDGMEKYFPPEKLVVTGNPVRKTIRLSKERYPEAFRHFELDDSRPVLLLLGGSLGARTLNESILVGLQKLVNEGIQVIWQCGGYYHKEMIGRKGDHGKSVLLKDFIIQMNYAYAVADVVISRAGALSIAELMLTGKPAILVPSPNVAEDHQTINALALVEKGAALMVADNEAREVLIDKAIELLKDKAKRAELSKNIAAMAHENAAIDIANQVIKLIA